MALLSWIISALFVSNSCCVNYLNILNNPGLYINGRLIDTRREKSVLSEWPEDWFTLAHSQLGQWYVQIEEGVDTRNLEATTGLTLGLYFPHNAYLLLAYQVLQVFSK